MRSYQRDSYGLPGRFDPPKPKSKAWIWALVIGIIVAVVVTVVVVLVLRARSTTTAGGAADCNVAGCPSPLLCNTTTTACVQCLTNANCTPPTVCSPSGACVDPECVNNIDCATGELCVEGACVDAPSCTVDADCNEAEGEICTAMVCACNEDAPTITVSPTGIATASPGADIVISGTYTWTQPTNASLESRTILKDPATETELLVGAFSNTAVGTIAVNSSVADSGFVFPGASYQLEQQMNTPCTDPVGGNLSTPEVFIPTSSIPDFTFGVTPFGAPFANLTNISYLVAADVLETGGPFGNNVYPPLGMIAYKTSGTHPNLADHFFEPVAAVMGPFISYTFNWVDANPPMVAPSPAVGETWYFRTAFYHQETPGNFKLGTLGPEHTWTIA